MYRPRQVSKADRRQAVILMVVLILLTLFAVIGIAFVFYSSSEATSSRIWREAQGLNVSQPDESPDYLLQYFLGQLIYDVDDNLGGASSAMRGLSLSRNMYGWDYDATSANNPNASFNANPFNGVGRLHNTYAAGALAGVDSYDLVNYTYFHSDGFVLDPERLEQSVRTDSGTTMAPALPQPANNIYVGANAPYTYPDKNNMYLAAMAADGTVLQQSFFRPAATGAPPQKGFQSLSPTDPNWTTAYGKYLLLRPRPQENPTFPMPASLGGDVKNLTGSPGTLLKDPVTGTPQLYNEDSIWMDLGFPVRQAADGTLYKPLFAAFVTDLDHLINLNVAGNLRASARSGPTKVIAAPYAHGSNQGWGRWEINPGWVLNQTGSSGQPEWPNLLLGTATPIKLNGRYGPNGAPGVGGLLAVPGDMPTIYGQADYDGGDEVNGGLSKPFQLPSPTSSPFSPFPTFTGGGTGWGWGNGTAVERTDHPLLYDYFAPQGDDANFDVSNMKALLVNMGQQASSSTLAQLCPNNFSKPTDPQSIRRRNLVTVISNDFDRPGMMPWLFPANASGPYQLPPAGSPFPIGGPSTFPSTAQLATPPTPGNGGEFGADWRGAGTWPGLNSILGRLDLDQLSSLQDYPPPTKNAQGQFYIDLGNAATAQQFQTAVNARQQLALAIFARLVYVTGAYNPNTAVAGTPPTQPQFDALRWLAQLSANIVDYVDNDDYMTPFPWVQLAGNAAFQSIASAGTWAMDPMGKGWVFGTEIPRVVINEAYGQVENDPNDPLAGGKARDYRINFWVELHDPMSNDPNNPNPDEQGSARLQQKGATDPATGQPIGVYRIAIAQSGSQSIYPGGTGANNNVLGYPDPAKVPVDFMTSQTVQGLTAFEPATGAAAGVDTSVLFHANGAYTATNSNGDNHGFYLVGPAAGPGQETPTAFPGGGTPPNAPAPTIQSTGLSYTVKAAVGGAGVGYPAGHTLFLQRLANPYMPYDPTPTDPNYNPFITVDFLDNVPTQDARQHDSNGLTANGNNPTIQWNNFHAWGKPEPFESFNFYCNLQNLATPLPNQPQHTFFRHNGPTTTPPAASTPMLNVPFHWLPQPDRQLISPMELLEVSGFKPHELTQMFVQPSSGGGLPGAPAYYQEVAPWSQQSALIYRLFEFLECHDRSLGIGVGGRQPGKININTIWDPETFFALCDPAPSGGSGPNDFAFNDVNQVGQNMMLSRTKNQITYGGKTYYQPAPGDVPFLPFAAPFAASGDTQYTATPSSTNLGGGINSTILRLTNPANPPGPANLGVFQVPNASGHPYIQNELLTKIANSVTTRSNVFAVFLTVGFFTVTDATTTPPTLGPEVGAAQNRNVRHQMFAIIDRTNLTLAPTVTTGTMAKPIPPGQASITTTMTLAPATGQIQTQNAAGGTLNTGAANGVITWQIQPGMSLVVDAGANQEIVQVQAPVTGTAATGYTFTATFLRNHAAGCNITIPGNPGPQPLFDYHSPTYAPVVPYAAILY